MYQFSRRHSQSRACGAICLCAAEKKAVQPAPFAKPRLRRFFAAAQLTLLIKWRSAHKRISAVHCVQAPMPSVSRLWLNWCA